MKTYIMLITFNLVMTFLSGGCIFRIKADTILTLHDPDNDSNSQKLGFKEVFWVEDQGDISLIGYGFHPKEHKTYVFFLNEGYPRFLPRYIRLRNTGRNDLGKPVYMIELLLCPDLFWCKTKTTDRKTWYLYTGRFLLELTGFFDKRIFILKDVELQRSNNVKDTIIVSGQIVAKKSSQDQY
jgi:hypothetical protein